MSEEGMMEKQEHEQESQQKNESDHYVEEKAKGSKCPFMRLMAFLRRKVWAILGWTLCLLLVLAFVAPMYCDYTTRTRLAEGLVLASSAKNLVVDNAANGLPFSQGWQGIDPTRNTQAIMIDAASGVIFIVSTPDTTEGGVVLALIPSTDGKRLVIGEVPKSRVIWECKTLGLGSISMKDIPTECRTLMTSTL